MALDLKKAKDQRTEFINMFAPSKLKAMSGKELLDRVFPNLSNSKTMADMVSTGTPDWVNVNGGSQAHWKLYYNKGTGQDKKPGWKTGNEHIDEKKAMEIAETIKKEIVKICRYIETNKKLDYSEIQALSDGNVYAKIENNRYLKYFALVYPEFFPLFYSQAWHDNIIKKYIKDTDFDLKNASVSKKLEIIISKMNQVYPKGDPLEKSIEYANMLIQKAEEETWFPKPDISKETIQKIKGILKEGDIWSPTKENKKSVKSGIDDIYEKALKQKKIELSECDFSSKTFLEKLRAQLPNIKFQKNEEKQTRYARYLDYFIEVADEDGGNETPTENSGNSGTPSYTGIKSKFPLNQILYGPPGTGKTYNSVIYAVAILGGIDIGDDYKLDTYTIKELQEKCVDSAEYEKVLKRYNKLKKDGYIEFITFHQSYGYEEFIQGIKPIVIGKGDERKVIYKVEDGIFKKFCDKANANKGNKYVFIIDEINRGNVSKIFGELITLIEESKRISASDSNRGMTVKLPYKDENGKDEFGVPDNVYILGTMNTADRSLVQLDAALRRRFRFEEMMPEAGLLTQEVKDENGNVTGINLEELLKAINERICALIDREHQIGHSYFMKVETIDDLRDTFQYEIIPLLQEYFYEDYENIDRVLNGNGFIEKKTKWDYVKEAETFVLNKEAIEEAKVNNFKMIYGDSNSKTEDEESKNE